LKSDRILISNFWAGDDKFPADTASAEIPSR
jgi:hypothetical protein